MKKLKVVLASVFAIAIVASLFAFTGKQNADKEVKFATVFRLYNGVTNPPTTALQVTTTSNWSAELSTRPSVVTPNSQWYYIEYNNTSTTFSQAINIMSAQVNTVLTDGQTFTDGSGHSVKIFLK
jgi:hypothetical protein